MPSKPATFSYEEALCVQIEGAITFMEQANHELMTVVDRVHAYMKEQADKKAKASQKGEGGLPPQMLDDDESGAVRQMKEDW